MFGSFKNKLSVFVDYLEGIYNKITSGGIFKNPKLPECDDKF